ncbi:MAG TPA: HAD family hydrolase, partial [Firmicutes bacterium]|nr:HAD family hydrolase [Bacillota bacterium]
MIRALFFDFYDTLCYVDDETYFAGKVEMGRILGIDPETFIKEWRKTGGESLIGKLESTKDRIAKVASVLGITLTDEKITRLNEVENDFLFRAAELYPNTGNVLNMLRRSGFLLGIISNASNTVEILRKKFNLDHYFNVIN